MPIMLANHVYLEIYSMFHVLNLSNPTLSHYLVKMGREVPEIKMLWVRQWFDLF